MWKSCCYHAKILPISATEITLVNLCLVSLNIVAMQLRLHANHANKIVFKYAILKLFRCSNFGRGASCEKALKADTWEFLRPRENLRVWAERGSCRSAKGLAPVSPLSSVTYLICLKPKTFSPVKKRSCHSAKNENLSQAIRTRLRSPHKPKEYFC